MNNWKCDEYETDGSRQKERAGINSDGRLARPCCPSHVHMCVFYAHVEMLQSVYWIFLKQKAPVFFTPSPLTKSTSMRSGLTCPVFFGLFLKPCRGRETQSERHTKTQRDIINMQILTGIHAARALYAFINTCVVSVWWGTPCTHTATASTLRVYASTHIKQIYIYKNPLIRGKLHLHFNVYFDSCAVVQLFLMNIPSQTLKPALSLQTV